MLSRSAVAAVTALLACAASSAQAATETVPFSATGEHAIVVPPGVTSLHVVAVGGQGGPGYEGTSEEAGGFGAVVTGDIAVTPGERLYLEVGGNGAHGEPYDAGGGGGGASDLRTRLFSAGLTPTDPRLLVAGGGGGSGRGITVGSVQTGGVGGNANAAGGGSGCQRGGCPVSGGGGAGAPIGTGAGGQSGGSEAGAPGALGAGGNGALIDSTYLQFGPTPGGYNGGGEGGGYAAHVNGFDISNYGGGGGGGGLGGGGGGGGVEFKSGPAEGGGGGGGGSNLVPAGGSASTDTTGSPSITVSFANTTPPVVSLNPLPAVANSAEAALSGTSSNALGDGSVTIYIYSGSTATGSPVATVTPTRDETTGAFTASLPEGLPDGQYTVQATQVDAAGNVGASAPSTFVLQNTPPVVTLTGPTVGAPGGPLVAPVVTLTGPASGASGAPKLVLGSAIASPTGASLSLTCEAVAGTACSGLAQLATLEQVLGSKVLALGASRKKRHSRRVTVGQSAFLLPSGQTQNISVPVNATGKKLLKQFGTLPATLTVSLLNANPPSVVQTKITIRTKRKQGKSHH